MKYLFLPLIIILMLLSTMACGVGKTYPTRCEELFEYNHPMRLRFILNCQFHRLLGIDTYDRSTYGNSDKPGRVQGQEE